MVVAPRRRKPQANGADSPLPATMGNVTTTAVPPGAASGRSNVAARPRPRASASNNWNPVPDEPLLYQNPATGELRRFPPAVARTVAPDTVGAHRTMTDSCEFNVGALPRLSFEQLHLSRYECIDLERGICEGPDSERHRFPLRHP